jgi:uncharacterized secreted protein with C-terminal beta-propeller domain
MNTENLFIGYYSQGDTILFLKNFFDVNSDLVPSWFTDKIDKLVSYDLSNETKMTELYYVFTKLQNSLTGEEQIELENNMQNAMDDYLVDHLRDLDYTGIARLDITSFDIEATGSVPGMLLNQFSMDEYRENLRVATTIGSNNWWGFGMSSAKTANDVYILNSDLEIQGSVQNLGLDESIYSVRFINDNGYVVTYKQVDPFYVLDLSDPENPKAVGELKIPGYSGYLHPLSEDLILGVGQEDWKVKISLFDVSDPSNPVETDKYSLNDYWTEVTSNHHAFLADPENLAFFMPGGNGGYVFSYANEKLELVKFVEGFSAKRAVYIDQYLYVLTDDALVVLDESDWTKVKEFEL